MVNSTHSLVVHLDGVSVHLGTDDHGLATREAHGDAKVDNFDYRTLRLDHDVIVLQISIEIRKRKESIRSISEKEGSWARGPIGSYLGTFKLEVMPIKSIPSHSKVLIPYTRYGITV